jgi:regulator of replication initiation timing
MNIREFFQKRKQIQSSLEEWENRGMELIAMQDALARNQTQYAQNIKQHPLLQNVYEKRDAYKQSIEIFREAEQALSGGQGEALKEELHSQFSSSVGELPPEKAISYGELQDKYVALLERMAGMERSLSELKEELSQGREANIQQHEQKPQRSLQAILEDEQSQGIQAHDAEQGGEHGAEDNGNEA